MGESRELYKHTAMGLYNLHWFIDVYIKHDLVAVWRLAGGPTPPLKIHIRRRHLLIHIKKLAPEPLHILVRQLLLLIQEIVDGHFPQQHMDTHKYGIHPTFRVVFLMRDVVDILLEWNSICFPLFANHLHKFAYPALGRVARAIKEEDDSRANINKH